MSQDEIYMKRALYLAQTAEGLTSPNPMVGCVIVKDGKIISEGCHEKYGSFHAERNAINSCSDKEALKGATIYVTLEPCCHYGKTPPCTDIIIESGIKHAIIGSTDDNPIVSHKGIEILKNNGISVKIGVLEKECRKLNEVFFHFIKHKTPFVAMKYAVTADGKIATYTGHSKYITCENSRKHVHKLRNKYSAIMVGINTVLEDDPMLNCRTGGKNPIRIICDTSLKIPLNSNIVKTADEIKTYIATGENINKEKADLLTERGIEIISTPLRNSHIDLNFLMKTLGEKNIDSVLLEGGGTLNYSAIECGIVNKIYAYIAPKILGGEKAKTPVEGIGFARADKGLMLKPESISQIDDDILICYDVIKEKTKCLQE